MNGSKRKCCHPPGSANSRFTEMTNLPNVMGCIWRFARVKCHSAQNGTHRILCACTHAILKTNRKKRNAHLIKKMHPFEIRLDRARRFTRTLRSGQVVEGGGHGGGGGKTQPIGAGIGGGVEGVSGSCVRRRIGRSLWGPGFLKCENPN